MVIEKISLKKLKSKKFSLVLSGGADYGVTHLGIIKKIEEEKLKPDEIIGTSMGAIIGALFAIGVSTKEMIKILKEIKLSTILKMIYKKGKIENKGINDELKKLFKNKKMSQAKIDLKIIATDIKTGKPIIFSKKDDVKIRDAVRASISIPGILSPKKIKNKYLIDGGVSSQLPVEFAKEKNIKIASNATNRSRGTKYSPKKGFFHQIQSRIISAKNTRYYLIENQSKNKLYKKSPTNWTKHWGKIFLQIKRL